MKDNPKLYKYLDVNGGSSMLHFGNLQFTNATRLNDPFDCHPALFDFSNAPDYPNEWPPKDFRVAKGKLDTKNLRNRAWICSLSKIHDSLPMWSYYCSNHGGVCIGLDMEKIDPYLSIIHCGIYIGYTEMEVQYRDVINKPSYFGGTRDAISYQLSTKAKAWEHEQEVRLLLLDPTAGPYEHPCFARMALPPNFKRKSDNESIDWKDQRAYIHLGGECFDSLYLGINMEPEIREKFIAEARKCNQDIKIYQMTIDPDAFRLKEEMIK